MKRSTLLRYVSLSLVGMLTVSACGLSRNPDSASSNNRPPEDNTPGVLTVGIEPAFPPFEFLAENGELQGFDVDLMKTVGERMGVDVKFESLPFDGLIAALQAESIDAAISGMTNTEERSQVVDFSRPYIEAGLAIAVQSSNTDIQGLQDLERKKIGVKIGTTGAEQAAEIPGAEISTFQAIELALKELANGSVDAVINDAPVTLDEIAKENISGVKVVGDLITQEYYGIAVPKGSSNLELINQALDEMMADGTYAEIYQRWFGTAPPPLPEKAL